MRDYDLSCTGWWTITVIVIRMNQKERTRWVTVSPTPLLSALWLGWLISQ